MDDRRKEPRRILMFYTRVFDAATGEHLGHLGDLNRIGLMIISNAPIEIGRTIRMDIELPMGKYMKDKLSLVANSVWCQEDLDPEYWTTGFHIQQISEEDFPIIDDIVKEYGIR